LRLLLSCICLSVFTYRIKHKELIKLELRVIEDFLYKAIELIIGLCRTPRILPGQQKLNSFVGIQGCLLFLDPLRKNSRYMGAI